MPFRIRFDLRYRSDLSDPLLLRAFAWSLPTAAVLGVWAYRALAAPVGRPAALLLGVAAFCAAAAAICGIVLGFTGGMAGALASFLLPRGRSTPAPRDFSLETSLVARGRVDEALALVEARLATAADDAELCVFAADLYAREAGRPEAAVELFRRARASARVSPAQELYATQRLVDLYLDVLGDHARAAEELRRIVQRHPGSRAAWHAGHALRSLSPAGPAANPG